MVHIYYGHPKDIVIHFAGETMIGIPKCAEIKRFLQFVGFLIFRMLSLQESPVSGFAVSMVLKNGRKIVRLCKKERSLFVLLETASHEWVVRLDGTKKDLKNFVMEYTIKALKFDEKKTDLKEKQDNIST